MQALFNPDSSFMKFMSRIGDLLLLNFFFLLTSLPIFTLGASLTAMYTVSFRFGTDREAGTTRSYFRAFKENFRQATVLWLVLLVLILMACINVVLFFLMPGWMHYLWILFAAVLVLALFVFCYSFPLLSQFDNRSRVTFKNALVLSIAYLPRSLVMAAMWVFPLWLLTKDLYLFLQCGFFFVTLYYAVLAYLSTKLLNKVFKPFMADNNPEEETQEENHDRP